MLWLCAAATCTKDTGNDRVKNKMKHLWAASAAREDAEVAAAA